MKAMTSIKNFFIVLLFFFLNIVSDPIYLNNANPFPLFSSQGRYDQLTRVSRDEIKEFILHGDDICLTKSNRKFHANFMPYWQFASTGSDYLGKNTVRRVNNRYLGSAPLDVASAVSDVGLTPAPVQQTSLGENPGANLYSTETMPLGAIPEPFNFFALFYENNPKNPMEPKMYAPGALIEARYVAQSEGDSVQNIDDVIAIQKEASVPNDSSAFNLVSKVAARYLGYNDTPYFIAFNVNSSQGSSSAGDVGTTIPNSLFYDYSNYKNNYYGMMSNPQYSDPQRLFGYGYYNLSYKKIGVRGTFEWTFDENCGLKIYTGFSNLDIDNIHILDTTTGYQGPTAAMMFARYPDQIYQLSSNQSPNSPGPYVRPNIYQLQDYQTPIMDNTSNSNFNDNFSNPSELDIYLPDEFKAAYLVNIQNNLDSLGKLINQSFRPYNMQSFDDTTFEIFYRKLFIYNKPTNNKKVNVAKLPLDHIPFTLMPTAAVHLTCPIAPRVPGNIVFGKPIDNNGHWELGGNVGVEFDFINNMVLGMDVGVSWYNNGLYENVPVPTNQFNEGVYLYNANVLVIPGCSYTVGLGMQVDELFNCFDFFIEYRLVRHAENDFVVQNVNDLLPVQYMKDTHTLPVQDNLATVDTVPNGILFLNFDQSLPYPTKDLVVVNHMREISSWVVNMFNITGNFRISQDISLGFVYQQPFWLRNAYDAITLGVSFEMFF